MDPNFWHQRWRKGEIGFHQGKPNSLMVRHFEDFLPAGEGRVFVPLCGKSLDIGWLRQRGHSVVGAELNRQAIEELLADLGIVREPVPAGNLSHYQADGLDLFVGDIFDLSPDLLGTVDVIYDRAALIALPDALRHRYTTHLRHLTATAPQFLLSVQYDPAEMNGPPFALPPEMVERHYGDHYDLRLVAQEPVPGGLKGRCEATEDLWLLRPK